LEAVPALCDTSIGSYASERSTDRAPVSAGSDFSPVEATARSPPSSPPSSASAPPSLLDDEDDAAFDEFEEVFVDYEIFDDEPVVPDREPSGSLPPPAPFSLASVKRERGKAKIGFDPEEVCAKCGRKGHGAPKCGLAGSRLPDSEQGARYLSFLFSRPGDKGFWPRRFKELAHLPLRERLQAIQAELIHRKARWQEGNPWVGAELGGHTFDNLRANLGAWAAIGAPNTTLSWLASGYEPRFSREPQNLTFSNHRSCRRLRFC
jgi:hypothetical protein